MKTAEEAVRFADIARTIFAPVYPVLAGEILGRTGIRRGDCIDIGGGTGCLGAALADMTDFLNVEIYDSSMEILSLGEKDYEGHRRITFRQGRVEEMPYPDGSFDLAVSRGSLFFWDDRIKAMDEIYRILKPGGYACLGCGFGSKKILEEIIRLMKKRNPEWNSQRQERREKYNAEYFRKIMEASLVPAYTIEEDEAGLWIYFKKL